MKQEKTESRAASSPGDESPPTPESMSVREATARRVAADYELPIRAIAITRERKGEHLYACVELELEETSGGWLVTGARLIEHSYHRVTVDEKAQLAVVQRAGPIDYRGIRCNWPISHKPHKSCNRAAVGKVTMPPGFKPIPQESMRAEFNVCISHAQLFVESYEMDVFYFDGRPMEVELVPVLDQLGRHTGRSNRKMIGYQP